MNKLSINENLIVEKANIVNCLAEAFCESVWSKQMYAYFNYREEKEVH